MDVCNGIAAALKAFLLTTRTHGYRVPRELLLEELREETRTPWWSIEGCVESEIGDRSQLLLYSRTQSRDRNKVQFSAIQSGLLAESLVPGYDRYFFSIRSPVGWPGWVGFDGNRLEEIRKSNPSDLAEYKGVVENDLVFYVPRRPLSKLGQKLDTFRQSLSLVWPQTVRDFRDQLGIPEILCREAHIHRNAWGIVLKGSVVFENWSDSEAHDLIHRFRRRIVMTARSTATPATGSVPFLRRLPIAYARVSVFRRDHRVRRLASFGLGADLVCTVQYQRMSRIRSPDIMGSTVESDGKWRVAWNRAWLASLED